jgi:hypothetical protein
LHLPYTVTKELNSSAIPLSARGWPFADLHAKGFGKTSGAFRQFGVERRHGHRLKPDLHAD